MSQDTWRRRTAHPVSILLCEPGSRSLALTVRNRPTSYQQVCQRIFSLLATYVHDSIRRLRLRASRLSMYASFADLEVRDPGQVKDRDCENLRCSCT